MKSKIYLGLAILILGLSLFLRLYKIENRAPFDWDQNRDYQAIASIATGKPTMIGPVAKGEGGFFLGPLYYYLATPAYLLSDGNPLSLPLTSGAIDIFSLLTILVLFPKVWGRTKTLALALVWALSWFMIESSRISWNVSLVPLWTLLMVYFLSFKDRLSMIHSFGLGLLVGLSWHIHAALIPLAPLILCFFPKKIFSPRQHVFSLLLGYLLALLPLLIFDLRHAGLERSLIHQFLSAKAIVTPPWEMVIESAHARFGKNLFAIFTGTSDLHFWWGTLAALISAASISRQRLLPRLAGLLVLLNLALVISLREVGFPEYYLTVANLSFLILLIDWCLSLANLGRLGLFALLIFFIISNTKVYDFSATPFSLARKAEIASTVRKLGDRIDLEFDLPLGRDSGIVPLLRLRGVSLDPDSPLKVIISESVAERMFIDGELTEDLGRFGGLRVSYRVVQ